MLTISVAHLTSYNIAVNNLKRGDIYNVNVIATNGVGQSKPLYTEVKIPNTCEFKHIYICNHI